APLRPRRRADLRPRGDGGRRLRGRRRPRPDRRHGAAQAGARRRQALHAEGLSRDYATRPVWPTVHRPRRDARSASAAGAAIVTASAWVCLIFPLAAALAIALLGERISRRGAGYLATASCGASFIAAVVDFGYLMSRSPGARVGHYSTAWSWLTAGSLDFGL